MLASSDRKALQRVPEVIASHIALRRHHCIPAAAGWQAASCSPGGALLARRRAARHVGLRSTAGVREAIRILLDQGQGSAPGARGRSRVPTQPSSLQLLCFRILQDLSTVYAQCLDSLQAARCAHAAGRPALGLPSGPADHQAADFGAQTLHDASQRVPAALAGLRPSAAAAACTVFRGPPAPSAAARVCWPRRSGGAFVGCGARQRRGAERQAQAGGAWGWQRCCPAPTHKSVLHAAAWAGCGAGRRRQPALRLTPTSLTIPAPPRCASARSVPSRRAAGASRWATWRPPPAWRCQRRRPRCARWRPTRRPRCRWRGTERSCGCSPRALMPPSSQSRCCCGWSPRRKVRGRGGGVGVGGCQGARRRVQPRRHPAGRQPCWHWLAYLAAGPTAHHGRHHTWRAPPPPAAAVKAGVEYGLRVAFGTALIVSVAAVWLGIAAISSSGQRDDDRRRGGGGGGYYYGGGPRFYFDLTDLLWYW